jgi:hypothetical protein
MSSATANVSHGRDTAIAGVYIWGCLYLGLYLVYLGTAYSIRQRNKYGVPGIPSIGRKGLRCSAKKGLPLSV